MATANPAVRPAAAPTLANHLYRAVWRWHFYAGLFVIPFMMLLAITGGLYLFDDEINGLVYGERLHVEVPASDRLPPSTQLEAALDAHPGALLEDYVAPAGADRSSVFHLATANGGSVQAYVDPYTGRYLGSAAGGDNGRKTWLMQFIEDVHSLDILGVRAEHVIEIVAGWVIILVFSGIYLWWPRGRRGGVVTLRGTPKKRIFWRDLHAVGGIFAGLFVVFLAFTGLPWSGSWGSWLGQIANRYQGGYPLGVWDGVPTSTVPTKEQIGDTGWTVKDAPMPLSQPIGAKPIGLDRAAEIVEGLGMAAGYQLIPPSDEAGVYSAQIFPDDLADQRIIHLDQYTGEPLVDAGFEDYGPVAKAVEWGINVHMGREFGRANQLILALACLTILVTSIAALVMWWKRRPRGSLGAPPAPDDRRTRYGMLAIMLGVGVLFPLTGFSLLIVLALDMVLLSRLPALRQALS
ncbi:MAG: PepSY domain-containing protein [Alphaproteobacteria bacterium]